MTACPPWPYDLTAEFYDEDMGRNANAGDISWYVAESKKAAARVDRGVLELGCGTGRITLPLAAEGLSVVAADRSLQMLRVMTAKAAAANLGGRIHPLALDMSRFGLGDRFAAILCPFSAFTYVVEEDDRSEMLAGIRNCLAPGGVLLMDVFIPDPSFNLIPAGEDIQDYHRKLPPGPWDPAVVLSRSKRFTRDVRPGINRIDRQYRFMDSSGALIREVHTQSFQRAYSPDTLVSVLQAAGFTDIQTFGDFEDSIPAALPARTTAVIAAAAVQ